jgi:hypothetical protein
MFCPGLPFEVHTGHEAFVAMIMCMYVYVDKLIFSNAQYTFMEFDVNIHGKYTFTPTQEQDIQSMNTLFCMDITDRCGFPPPRKVWMVKKLF